MGRKVHDFLDQSEDYSSAIEIESKPLQRLLGRLTQKWGWGEIVTNCHSPYIRLVHAWDEALEESRKGVEVEEGEDEKARDELVQARVDLAELLKMLSASSGNRALDEYLRNRKSFLEDKTITHNALWTLFPPGTPIVSHPFLDQPQVFSVESCDGFLAIEETFELVCYSFDFDGYEFNRVPFQMKIPYWGPDRRSIIELPFYPLKYHVDVTAKADTMDDSVARLKKKLIKRGQKFVDACVAANGAQMFKYSGGAHFHTGHSLLHRAERSIGEGTRSSDGSLSASHIFDFSTRYGQQTVSKKKVCVS